MARGVDRRLPGVRAGEEELILESLLLLRPVDLLFMAAMKSNVDNVTYCYVLLFSVSYNSCRLPASSRHD